MNWQDWFNAVISGDEFPELLSNDEENVFIDDARKDPKNAGSDLCLYASYKISKYFCSKPEGMKHFVKPAKFGNIVKSSLAVQDDAGEQQNSICKERQKLNRRSYLEIFSQFCSTRNISSRNYSDVFYYFLLNFASQTTYDLTGRVANNIQQSIEIHFDDWLKELDAQFRENHTIYRKKINNKANEDDGNDANRNSDLYIGVEPPTNNEGIIVSSDKRGLVWSQIVEGEQKQYAFIYPPEKDDKNPAILHDLEITDCRNKFNRLADDKRVVAVASMLYRLERVCYEIATDRKRVSDEKRQNFCREAGIKYVVGIWSFLRNETQVLADRSPDAFGVMREKQFEKELNTKIPKDVTKEVGTVNLLFQSFKKALIKVIESGTIPLLVTDDFNSLWNAIGKFKYALDVKRMLEGERPDEFNKFHQFVLQHKINALGRELKRRRKELADLLNELKKEVPGTNIIENVDELLAVARTNVNDLTPTLNELWLFLQKKLVQRLRAEVLNLWSLCRVNVEKNELSPRSPFEQSLLTEWAFEKSQPFIQIESNVQTTNRQNNSPIEYWNKFQKMEKYIKSKRNSKKEE